MFGVVTNPSFAFETTCLSMTQTSLQLLPVSRPTPSSRVFVEDRDDVAEAGGWCRHVGLGQKSRFGPWDDLPMRPNWQQPATRRFPHQSLPLPVT